MFRILLALLAALMLGATPALAQPANPAPSARIADLAWLEGYWAGEGFGGLVDESWMPARNGAMIGVFRSLKPDGSTSFYEILGIEESEGSLRLVVKHFHPDWVGWEEKYQAVKLRLTRISSTEAAFGGVVLKRAGDNDLVVEVTIRRKDGTSSTSVLKLRKK
jgi:hypothetical protein